MYRNVINDLSIWYEEPKRKILCIKGALGVGKTWTVKDFCLAFFETQHYIDCKNNPVFYELFNSLSKLTTDESGISSEYPNIIAHLDNALNVQFQKDDFSEDVLIFDNTEHISNLSTFFYEYAKKHRKYNICLIASTMKIDEFEYSHPDVFRIVRMRPMTFEEYMIANKARPFIAAIENHKRSPLSSLEANAISSMLKEYMLIGGMPAAVKEFIKSKDLSKVRSIQENIIESYMKLIKECNKSAMAQRCRRIWTNIPKQLSLDNKKFMYRYVEENARAREYSEAVQILCDLGITRKLPRLIKGEFPLEEHVDYKSFELFYIDHGILRASLDLPISDSLTLKEIFEESNYAVAEQYVFQELSNKLGNIYYWTSGATARIPFVYESENCAVPVDIQVVENNKAQNIKTFCAKNDNIEISVRVSLDQVSFYNNTLNIPAYGLWNM